MSTFRSHCLVLIVVLVATLALPALAMAASEGTLTFALHYSLPALDPADTDNTITPFLTLYAIHDGLLKPMPGAASAPSLAESWSMTRDGLSAEFTLRPGVRFHNGDPVTAEDVKFSFERFRGGSSKALKAMVKDVVITSPTKIRFVFKEPFVSFTPGVELVLEAFDGYWRKPPSIKRLVFRIMPDEVTRAAALKRGEVDVVPAERARR